MFSATMTFLTKFSSVFLPLFLCIFCIWFYHSSVQFDFHYVDDQEYVELNSDIKNLNLESVQNWFRKDYVLMYVPLTICSFAFDYHFWRLNPSGYRMTNIALHTISVLLVYVILFYLVQNRAIAFLVALLFAAHPVQIESVVWISERKNVLSTIFFLLCVLSYRKSKFWMCCASFLCAILSKPNTVVLPLLLIASDWFYSPAFPNRKRNVLIGFMTVCALFLFVYMIQINHETEINFRGGSVLINTYVMLTVFFRYIGLLIFPGSQQLYYLTKVYDSWADPIVLSSMIGFVSLLGIAFWLLIKKEKIGFWILWFLITLLPTSNFFVPMGSLMHDRYLYLPIIGFFAIPLILIRKLLTRFKLATIFRLLLLTATLSVVCSYTALAHQRLSLWGRSPDLWAHDVLKSKYPDARLLLGLASELAATKKPEIAIQQFETINSVFGDLEAKLRQTAYLMTLNRFDDVKRNLDAIDVDKISQSRYWLGFYYDMHGRYWSKLNDMERAGEYFHKSLAISKQTPVSIHLAEIYFVRRQVGDAIKTLQDALQLDPDSQELLTRLCSYLLDERRYEEAFLIYERLRVLYPENQLVGHISKQIALQLQKD